MRSSTLQVLVLAPEPGTDDHRGQADSIRRILSTAFGLIAMEFTGHSFAIASRSTVAHAEVTRRQWAWQAHWPIDDSVALGLADVVVIIGGPAEMRTPDYAAALAANKPTYMLYLPRRL